MQGQLSEIAEALEAFNMGIERGKNEGITVILGSAVDASIAVSHIFRFLKDLYKAYSVTNTTTAGFSNARWLEKQFNDIWADIQSVSAAHIRSNKRRKPLSGARAAKYRAESRVTADIPTIDLQQDIGRKFTSISRKRKTAVKNNSIEVSLPIGSVRLFCVIHRQSGQILGARLLFFPARHV